MRVTFANLLRSTWRNSTFSPSQPPEEFLSSRQPGGTATVICDNWTSRVIDRGEDHLGLGRWSYITLRGKGSAKVTIVSAYNSTPSSGETTNFQQQHRTLSRIHRQYQQQVTAQPRRQFILDFQAWLEYMIADGHDLIIGMDANDTYDPDSQGVSHPLSFDPALPTVSTTHNGKLSTLISSCGLKDPMALQHQSRPFPASHIRGTKRIDYLLVTPRLAPAVLNSGSLAFHSLFHSDHRAYFLDFDSRLLFADPAYEIAPPSYHRLQLSDPCLKNQYRDEQLQYHKVYDKVQELQVASRSGVWTDVQTQEYQKLDRIITEAMLYAERNTGRRFSTRYEWSPTLKKSVQSFRYWQLRYRQARNLGISLPKLNSLKEQAGLTEEEVQAESTREILLRLQQAADQLRKHQRQHKELRSTHLEELAEAIVLDRSPGLAHESVAQVKEERVANQIKQLLKRENLRRMFRKIKRILKPVAQLGLSRVDIPDVSSTNQSHGDPTKPKDWKGPWLTITKPSDIASVIKNINKAQYHQAHETPFGSGPVAEAFGRRGDTELADSVLNGNVPPTLRAAPILPETCSILETLAKEFPTVPCGEIGISSDEFVAVYSVAKESTSSSPSGRHIGHYKVATKDPTLAQLHSRMMSFPFQHGFAPDRWKRVTDIMLEKETGNSRCHRLRILALFESDFNNAKRIVIGHRLMHHLEDFDLLSPMQHGSRPGRQCISAVLKKVLAHDYVRLTVTTAAFIENDAIGCYDRLVNNLILMLLKKLGLPPSVSHCMAELWDSVVHLIKTVYGISDVTYGSTPEYPLYGPGQGSTCGPLFWLLCYWVIVESIDPTMSSMKFISACKSVMVEVFGASFVDDSSLGVTSTYTFDPLLSMEANRTKEIAYVVTQLRALAQHWERLLYSTGGAINMQKSHWYLISWIWTNDIPRLATIRSTPAGLALTTGCTEIQENVPRIEPTQSFRTLGVYIAGSGNQAKQAAVLRSHADQYHFSLQKAIMTPPEAYCSYMMFLRPRLLYPLPCSSLTQKQCRNIQAPALAALLPKLHLNRHTPRAVLFGGLKYGGLDLPELYTDQGHGQLQLMIGHLKLRDEVGSQLLCFLSELQLLVGSLSPVFTLPYKVYGQWVGDYWMVSLWKHLSQVNMTLEIENAWCPKLARQYDASIMDLAVQFNLNHVQLREINACRVYLQVITLSDISDAAGIRLLPTAIQGVRDMQRHSSLHWPQWPRPANWASWHILLYLLSTRGRLLRDLGEWIDTTHQKWNWYYDASQDVVYHLSTANQWIKYTPATSLRVTRRSRTVYRDPTPTSPPDLLCTLYPTTIVTWQEDHIRSLPGNTPLFEQTAQVVQSLWPLSETPPELVDTPIYYQSLIDPAPPKSTQCSDIAEVLKEDLELLCCTDGSFVRETGQCHHGWIISNEVRQTLAEGSGPGHGNTQLLSSYRAELGGLLALLYIVNRISVYHSISTGKMRIYCDNRSALNTVTTSAQRGITPFLTSDYDLIDLIRIQASELSFPLVGEWVKGHYTGNKREFKHDLNDRADYLATLAHQNPSPFTTKPSVEAPPGYHVRLSDKNGLITSQLYKMLVIAHHEQPIIDHIKRKTGWTDQVFHSIDWDSHHRAFRRLTRYQRIGMTKIVHNLSYTNRQNNLLYGTSENVLVVVFTRRHLNMYYVVNDH